jgi:uncharacterized protein
MIANMAATSTTVRDRVIQVLRENSPLLRQRFGVRSLLLFGSLARGDATDESDVDLLVDFDRPTGYFGLVRLQLFLQELLGRDVDLGTPASLRPAMLKRVEQEAVRVA